MKAQKMTAQLWEKRIRMARGLYLKVDENRFKIAQLAVDTCYLRHGGDVDRRFTAKRFAQAIGLNHKTLYEWIKVKQLVVDKLRVREDVTAIKYSVLICVRERVDETFTQHQVRRVLNEELNRDPTIFKWRKYIEVLTTIFNNVSTPIKLMEIPKDTIEEAIKLSGLISTLLKKELEFRESGHSSGAEAQALRQVNKFNSGVRAAVKAMQAK